MTNWRWKYFTKKELSSRDDGSFVFNEDALDKLEKMRVIMGAPLVINSGTRSKKHNKEVGGKENSMHVLGRAFDVSNKGHDPKELYQAALQAGFTGFGFGRTYLHVDTGDKRWWEYGKGNRNMYITVPFEKPPAKKLNNEEKGSLAYIYSTGFSAKDSEKPNKIEGVPLSDNQTKVAVAATGAVGVSGITAVISDPQIIEIVLKFLQNANWHIAAAALGIGLIVFLWHVLREKR